MERFNSSLAHNPKPRSDKVKHSWSGRGFRLRATSKAAIWAGLILLRSHPELDAEESQAKSHQPPKKPAEARRALLGHAAHLESRSASGSRARAVRRASGRVLATRRRVSGAWSRFVTNWMVRRCVGPSGGSASLAAASNALSGTAWAWSFPGLRSVSLLHTDLVLCGGISCRSGGAAHLCWGGWNRGGGGVSPGQGVDTGWCWRGRIRRRLIPGRGGCCFRGVCGASGSWCGVVGCFVGGGGRVCGDGSASAGVGGAFVASPRAIRRYAAEPNKRWY